jgi:uncharacterized protein (DUF1697 family)
VTRCAVLLRGVNVGRGNRIAMADLRALLERLGAADVRTYLQSGNAVVDWDRPGALAPAVEAALRDELSLPVRVLVRTADEVDAVVASCPFEVADPKLLHAWFLSGPPPADLPDVSPDRMAPGPHCLYVAYATGSQGSPVEKWRPTGMPDVLTARNWRTVLALQELLHA